MKSDSQTEFGDQNPYAGQQVYNPVLAFGFQNSLFICDCIKIKLTVGLYHMVRLYGVYMTISQFSQLFNDFQFFIERMRVN